MSTLFSEPPQEMKFCEGLLGLFCVDSSGKIIHWKMVDGTKMVQFKRVVEYLPDHQIIRVEQIKGPIVKLSIQSRSQVI